MEGYICLTDIRNRSESGNYLVATIAFIAAAFFSSRGITAGPNMVIKVIAYIVVIAITIGGVIADIWGIIQAIRYR